MYTHADSATYKDGRGEQRWMGSLCQVSLVFLPHRVTDRRSIIIDLSMFDPDDDDHTVVDGGTSSLVRRSCWHESTLLTNLINALPSLNHISFFADASDDSTLALLFASLISHPSSHPVPPPTVPSSPSARSNASGYAPPLPFATRIQSFGWRQRAPPPPQFRLFSQSSTFVSTLHLIRHAHRLSFLVLDADLDEMYKEDILAACKELNLREPPYGEEAEKVSLMLCGPIRGWSRDFLRDLVDTFKGVKELFIDRPLRKSTKTHETTIEAFVSDSSRVGKGETADSRHPWSSPYLK